MAEAAPASVPSGSEAAAEAGQSEEQAPQTIEIPGVTAGAPSVLNRGANATLIPPPALGDPEPDQPSPQDRLSKIEEQYKSLQGIHKSLEAKAKQGEEATKLYLTQRETAQQLVNRLQESERQLEAMRTEIQQLRSVVPSQPKVEQETQSATEQKLESMTDEVLSALDSEELDQIAAQYGPQVANATMMKKAFSIAEKFFGGRIQELEAKLLEKIQPYEHSAAAEAEMAAATELWEGIGSIVHDRTGELAFPELKDPVAAQQIARIWANETGWTQEFKYNPQKGPLAAISLYRQWKAYQDSMAAQQPQPAQVQPQPNNDLDATTSPLSRPAVPMSYGDRIRANFRLREADDQLKRLGFAP